jgi:hypothetical protein
MESGFTEEVISVKNISSRVSRLYQKIPLCKKFRFLVIAEFLKQSIRDGRDDRGGARKTSGKERFLKK